MDGAGCGHLFSGTSPSCPPRLMLVAALEQAIGHRFMVERRIDRMSADVAQQLDGDRGTARIGPDRLDQHRKRDRCLDHHVDLRRQRVPLVSDTDQRKGRQDNRLHPFIIAIEIDDPERHRLTLPAQDEVARADQGGIVCQKNALASVRHASTGGGAACIIFSPITCTQTWSAPAARWALT